MSFVTCPACNNSISDQYNICPNCGYQIYENRSNSHIQAPKNTNAIGKIIVSDSGNSFDNNATSEEKAVWKFDGKYYSNGENSNSYNDKHDNSYSSSSSSAGKEENNYSSINTNSVKNTISSENSFSSSNQSNYTNKTINNNNQKVKKKDSGLSIASAVCALLCCAPIGVLLGLLDLVSNRNDGKRHGGSVFGIIMGSIATFFMFVGSCSNFVSENQTKTAGDPAETVVNEEVMSEIEEVVENEQEDSIWASSFTPINDFKYSIDKDQKTITLSRYEGDDTKIMLSPKYIIDGEEYRLISLGDDACFLSETHITSVYVPDGVEFIGGSCFNSCSSLRDIRLPSTINEIGNTFLTYFGEYEVVYDDISTPSEYDETNYSFEDDDSTNAEQMGEDTARALNGFLGGLNQEENSDSVVTIHFGGDEAKWNELFPNY